MDARHWRMNDRTRLHWRQLDDDWMVYDEGSGDTHQLDRISAAALTCLEAEPHDLAGLTEVLASELGLPAGEALASKIESLLEQFGRLGLIEPVAP
jgi:PqqD family protein of HPr-rel-A system